MRSLAGGCLYVTAGILTSLVPTTGLVNFAIVIFFVRALLYVAALTYMDISERWGGHLAHSPVLLGSVCRQRPADRYPATLRS